MREDPNLTITPDRFGVSTPSSPSPTLDPKAFQTNFLTFVKYLLEPMRSRLAVTRVLKSRFNRYRKVILLSFGLHLTRQKQQFQAEFRTSITRNDPHAILLVGNGSWPTVGVKGLRSVPHQSLWDWVKKTHRGHFEFVDERNTSKVITLSLSQLLSFRIAQFAIKR